MFRGSMLDAFLSEMDSWERPNGYPGHATGRELPEYKPRPKGHTGRRPTAVHPWRHTQDQRRASNG